MNDTVEVIIPFSPYEAKLALKSELAPHFAAEIIRSARARQVRLMDIATAEIERRADP
jgi:hypothetical protein